MIPLPASAATLLVVQVDGKGVVMRPEGLREPTRRTAEAATRTLRCRLAPGERPNRKRMATLACVFDAGPAIGERAEFKGELALDWNRLKRIMKRNDPAVYPGTDITCVHDPAKAPCEKARRGRGEGLPEHGGCLPLACRNVALAV